MFLDDGFHPRALLLPDLQLGYLRATSTSSTTSRRSPRMLNVDDYLDYITNRVMPDFCARNPQGARRPVVFLGGAWARKSPPSEFQSPARPAACPADGLAVGDMSKFMFMIMLQDFMDPWTFNQKNLMKCCKEFLLPGGKQIPFCAYNTIGYREQARAQLDAMEPARRQARRDGVPFTPQPVVFDVKNVQWGRTDTIGELHAIQPVVLA